jgi:hypothetical protein
VVIVFGNNFGKLLVCASSRAPQRNRLRSVRNAAQETARLLKLDFEMVKFKENASQIYVYYENGEDEPIPIYCDEGKQNDPQSICSNLRKMIFVLSFHPRNSALQKMRSEITALS